MSQVIANTRTAIHLCSTLFIGLNFKTDERTRDSTYFHKAIYYESPVIIPDYVTTSSYHGTKSHKRTYIKLRTLHYNLPYTITLKCVSS